MDATSDSCSSAIDVKEEEDDNSQDPPASPDDVEGPFTCVECGCCELEDEDALEDHVAAVHMQYFPYRCKPCAEEHEDCWLATRQALKAHTHRVHPMSKPQSMYIPDRKKDSQLADMITRCKTGQFDPPDSMHFKLFISEGEGRLLSSAVEQQDHVEDGAMKEEVGDDVANPHVSPLHMVTDGVTDAISMVVPPTIFSGISRQCRLCERVIDSGTSLVQHVLYHHFPHKTILCPYCDDYSSRANVTDVRGHVARAHPDMPVKVVDRRHEFAQEVEELRRRCFPLSKEGKFSWTNTATVQNAVSRDASPTSESSETESNNTKLTCSLCGETCSSSSISRHVLKRHFNKKRIFCPYCSFGVRDDEAGVRSHIETTHSNEKVHVIDKRGHFEKELQTLQASCFPSVSGGPEDGEETKKETAGTGGGKHMHCRVCGRLARSSHTRHVMWHHLNTNVLKCPMCQFGRRDGITNVRAHIEKCHPGCTEEVIDLREQFRPEIDRLKAECFGIGGGAVGVGEEDSLAGLVEPVEVVAGVHQVGPCKLCGRVVNRDHALSHVRNCHFSRKLYSCPQCSFQTSVSISRVRLHIRQRHRDQGNQQPIDHSADFRNQLIKLRKYCFPDVGSRGEQPPETGEGHEPSATEHKPVRNQSSGQGSSTGSGAYICALCHRRADGPQRHVMTHHMGGRPLIRCPYSNCDFSSRHSMCRALMHLKSVHKDSASKPIDDRAKYREQILKMARKCFPAAPLLRLCADISRDTAEQALAEVDDTNTISNDDDEVTNDGYNESTYSSENAGSGGEEPLTEDGSASETTINLPIFGNSGEEGATTLLTEDNHSSASIQCQLCNEWCPCDRQRRHVTVRHLRHKVLQCGYCNYGEAAGNVTIVRRHLRSRHPGKPLKMIDRRNALAAEIQRIKYACFPANTPSTET